jgi:phosphoribosyl-ATP pyrophosphohydrolase
MKDTFERLMGVIEERKTADPASSYTAKLMHAGVDAMNKKVLEEAYETCVAAREQDRGHLVRELADLFYHALVLAASCGVKVAEIAGELDRRSGVSGLAEKASRGQT